MKNYIYALGGGIHRSPEFEKKGLAEFAVNVGLRCGHDCTYCSSRAMLRCHTAFKTLGKHAFATGYSIVDPDIAERVAEDAKRVQHRGLVQICTTVDAWAPESQELHLGRRCLEAILAEPRWTVRILTKNAAVVEDFDLIKKHRDRVLVGLSLTGTPDKEGVLAVVEPHASPISERMAALQKAHKLGLRTYGMLCPLLPGIADAPEQIGELVRFVKQCGAEEVLSALSGVARQPLFEDIPFPLRSVYVFVRRLNFDPDAQGSTTLTTGWFVWERAYRGEPVLRWISES